MRLHDEEFRRLLASDSDGRGDRAWKRASRVLKDRYPGEYEAAYKAALAEFGYELQPCNPLSTSTTLAGETSAPGAVSPAPEPVNPWLEESTMTERIGSHHLSEAGAL